MCSGMLGSEVCVCSGMCMCLRMCAQVFVCVCVCVCVYMHTFMGVCVCVCVCTFMHACIHGCVWCVCTFMQAYIHGCVWCACVRSCMHVSMDVCMFYKARQATCGTEMFQTLTTSLWMMRDDRSARARKRSTSFTVTSKWVLHSIHSDKWVLHIIHIDK